MSLDVYLKSDGIEQPVFRPGAIFIREEGQQREITRAEWDEKFPGAEPRTVAYIDEYVYDANITHNLNAMAAEAKIYKCLWRPDENGIEKAEQLIEPLQAGLTLLVNEPERFQAFNSSNGWGSYDGLVLFVGEYLDACQKYPSAVVSVSR